MSRNPYGRRTDDEVSHLRPLPLRAARLAAGRPLSGVRRAHSKLARCSPAALFALLWLVRPLLNWLATSSVVVRSALLLQILAIPVGFMLARLHWHRLRDAAGFSGGILVPISGLAIAVTVAAGSWAAVQLAGVAPRSALLVALSSVIIAYGVALHDYLAD
jgi:hypothetical protein